MVTPYRIAFSETDPLEWIILNFMIDFTFLIDIIFSFMSAYYTDEFVLVDNRCTIAQNYMMSWFLIDILAIIPFENMVT